MNTEATSARPRTIDQMDTLAARLDQANAVVATLTLAFSCEHSRPSDELVASTLWAVRELLDQAQAAVQ